MPAKKRGFTPAATRVTGPPREIEGGAREAQLTGSHRALEEFLGPRFHIRVHRGESAFRGLAR
jgi:hypothetical protein